jgi:hypothetical protein
VYSLEVYVIAEVIDLLGRVVVPSFGRRWGTLSQLCTQETSVPLSLNQSQLEAVPTKMRGRGINYERVEYTADTIWFSLKYSARFNSSDQQIYFFSPIPTVFFAFVSNESSLWFEFEENVSPTFWPALLSDWGYNVEAMLSPVPLK